MTDDTTHPDAADALIAAYLEAAQAGEAPDRAALLAEHPECADDLREFSPTWTASTPWPARSP